MILREVAFVTTYLSNPCPSFSRYIYIYIYKLTRSRAPHAHTSFSFDSSALASPHEQGRVRQSSCNLSLSSVPGHHPARLARVTPSLAPSPLFVQKTKEDLSKRREDNGADGLIDPAYIGFIERSKLGNWCKSSNGFRREKRAI